MGRQRTFKHLEPGEEREMTGPAVEYPWQYKNNIVRWQKRDGMSYEIEIIRRDGRVFFRRNTNPK